MKQDQTVLLLMPQLTCLVYTLLICITFLLFFWILRSKGTASMMHLINLNVLFTRHPSYFVILFQQKQLGLSMSSLSFTLYFSRRGRSLALIDSCCKPVSITWINNDCTKEALYLTVLSTACEENMICLHKLIAHIRKSWTDSLGP